MSYINQTVVALAGQIAKGDQSRSVSAGERNVGEDRVSAGYFVAMVADGVQALSSLTDTVAGAVVRSTVQNTYEQDEYLSTMKIGHGDGIWCVLEGDAERGDKIHIRVVAEKDKPSGSVMVEAIEDKTIPTQYIVNQITGGLAEVTRAEVIN